MYMVSDFVSPMKHLFSSKPYGVVLVAIRRERSERESDHCDCRFQISGETGLGFIQILRIRSSPGLKDCPSDGFSRSGYAFV